MENPWGYTFGLNKVAGGDLRQEEGSVLGAQCQEGELVQAPSPGSRLWGAPVPMSRAGPRGGPGDGRWMG